MPPGTDVTKNAGARVVASAQPASRAWVEVSVAVVSVGLAAGLYVWMLARPGPIVLTGDLMRDPDADPLAGLVAAVMKGLAGSIMLVAALRILDPAGAWRGRVTAASAGLYLAGALSALGPAALVLAPAVVLLELGLLALVGKTTIRLDGLVLALHVGGFGTAIAFFHQWPRYRSGAREFVRNLSALLRIWL